MHPSKRKGDKGEREAVEAIVALAGDLALPNARRKLGAGRRDDMGDLDVLDGVAVQVRAMGNLARALRSAAEDARIQAERAGVGFGLGMAPVPRAKASSVRWLAATLDWPGGSLPADEVARFGLTEAAVAHARNESIGVPRRRRVAVVERKDHEPLWIAPLAAWVDAWRRATRSRPEAPVGGASEPSSSAA